MNVLDVRHTVRVPVPDATHVGAARRTAAQLAAQLGLDETERGVVGVVVSEAATNLAKHARGGELLLRGLGPAEGGGFEMIALDRGPGIGDVAGALRDGFSTTGTTGHGLGAMSRMASTFDIYSRSGGGTAVLARVGGGPPRIELAGAPLALGVVCLAQAGEPIPGDDWGTVALPGGGALVLVADGLGHGPLAADAARAAVDVLRTPGALLTPVDVLNTAHRMLRPTRGAAVAVAEVGAAAGSVRYAGVGNIAGVVVSAGVSRSLVSHNGIVGHEMRKAQSFDYDAPVGSLLIMHSDGLTSQWRMENYPGLVARHPALVAGILHRDAYRGRDDVTVVVVRLGDTAA